MNYGNILEKNLIWRGHIMISHIDWLVHREHSIETKTTDPNMLCAAAVSLLLGRVGRWSGRDMDASQAERLGRSCLSIACSALSLARSNQAERDKSHAFSCVQPAFINL
ncbi:hypothetical protein EVAR_66848_1 [Eumeta japonica]|uniref:Uncharacterized protein n=1 Tax=Eumeta variegata TaxID=151549 RepID=A0A4C1ZA14_EUMVA|nr:hypothetical protein EVAR_66848_1 [Eumeta japonica]